MKTKTKNFFYVCELWQQKRKKIYLTKTKKIFNFKLLGFHLHFIVQCSTLDN